MYQEIHILNHRLGHNKYGRNMLRKMQILSCNLRLPYIHYMVLTEM